MFHESRHLVGSIHARYVVHFNILKNSSSIVSYRPSILPSGLHHESGCKGNAYFSTSKFFQAFFKTFFSAVSKTSRSSISFKLLPSPALSLESGCKDKRRNSLFPNFLTSIFKVFYKTLDIKALKKHTSGHLLILHHLSHTVL